MKKVFSLMLLLVAMLVFTACSGDEDEALPGISQEQLLGVWDATDVQFNNDGKWLNIPNYPDLSLAIYFYDNGKYYGEGALGYGEGTYSLSGNTIKTYVDGKLYCTYIVESLKNNIAELSLVMGSESMKVRAKKGQLKLGCSDTSLVGIWEASIINGDAIVLKVLQVFNDTFAEQTVTKGHLGKYTFEDIIISDNGVDYILDSRERTHYRYSFYEGKLVLRDLAHFTEAVYTATKNGDELILSDGAATTVYHKQREGV